MLLDNLTRNAGTAQSVLKALVGTLPPERSCECGHALEKALLTPPAGIPPAARERLDMIIRKYLQ
jgi:5'-methylthioadenosine phosphorylase